MEISRNDERPGIVEIPDDYMTDAIRISLMIGRITVYVRIKPVFYAPPIQISSIILAFMHVYPLRQLLTSTAEWPLVIAPRVSNFALITPSQLQCDLRGYVDTEGIVDQSITSSTDGLCQVVMPISFDA